MKTNTFLRGGIISAVCGLLIMFGIPALSHADGVKPDYEASPEYYKVIAESDEMRVILATWPPGAKDAMHSHPKPFAVYRLKNCDNKITSADGKSKVNHIKVGSTVIKGPVKAHFLENIGTTECQAVLVELKK